MADDIVTARDCPAIPGRRQVQGPGRVAEPVRPDAVVQDPIGPSPFDPAGDGHRGPEAMRAFWELDKAKLVEA